MVDYLVELQPEYLHKSHTPFCDYEFEEVSCSIVSKRSIVRAVLSLPPLRPTYPGHVPGVLVECPKVDHDYC